MRPTVVSVISLLVALMHAADGKGHQTINVYMELSKCDKFVSALQLDLLRTVRHNIRQNHVEILDGSGWVMADV